MLNFLKNFFDEDTDTTHWLYSSNLIVLTESYVALAMNVLS